MLDPAAVQFQLLLASSLVGEPAAPAALTGEIGAHAGEPREHVLKLRGFHLELGLARSCAQGKDLQDQPCPVQDLRVQHFFQVSGLHRSQRFVKEDDVRIELLHLFF